MNADASPAYSAVAIVNDTVIPECRAIYVGFGGDISVNMKNVGTAVVLKGAVTGTILPIRAVRVNATATTATDLVALY